MSTATITRNPWFNKGKLYCPVWAHCVVTLNGELQDPETFVEAKGATDGEDPDGYIMRKPVNAELVRDSRTGVTHNFRGVHRVNGAVALLRVASTGCGDCIDQMRDAEWWLPNAGFNNGPITLSAVQMAQYKQQADDLFKTWSGRDKAQEVTPQQAQAAVNNSG